MNTLKQVILIGLLTTGAAIAGEEPLNRQPSGMAISLPAEISAHGPASSRLRMKLTFVNEGGLPRKFRNTDFKFYLLDEAGVQIPLAFYESAVTREVVLEGAAPEYIPPIAFHLEGRAPALGKIEVGKQYQIICVLRQASGMADDLVSVARFTLIK